MEVSGIDASAEKNARKTGKQKRMENKKENGYTLFGYNDDIPFAWKHIVLVDKRSHAGRVISKIKQEIRSESRNLEKSAAAHSK